MAENSNFVKFIKFEVPELLSFLNLFFALNK